MEELALVISSGTLQPKGGFDKNHITGTESLRGASSELARWRGTVVEDVIKRSESETVTTDAIRYILDGIRDYDVGDRISEDEIDLFVEYVKRSELNAENNLEERTRIEAQENDFEIAFRNEEAEKLERSASGTEEIFNLPAAEEYLLVKRMRTIRGGQPPDGYEQEPPINQYPEVITSDRRAAFFVSDLHLSDGGPGDDFLHPHLESRRTYVVGAGQKGQSKAHYLARVISFVIQRLQKKLNDPDIKIDVVLNGDIIDQLELLGRNSFFSNAKHGAFLSMCENLQRAGHNVFYNRGNHDFIPPNGPWTLCDSYANSALETFAEHGDRYDAFNWPKGLKSTGSRIVTGASNKNMGLAELEASLSYRSRLDKWRGINSEYYHAGIDNVRPLTASTVFDFFKRRGTLFTAIRQGAGRGVDALKTFLREEIGQKQGYDAKSELDGAKKRRTGGAYNDWLVVMGHTHEPVSVPGAYYNTGSWIPVLRLLEHNEAYVSVDPFLVVYKDPSTSNRVEEFFTLNATPVGASVLLRDQDSINRLRKNLFGIDAVSSLPQ